MNLQALRAFAAVVQHGGFSRAAAAMHLSQPAVSKAVRSLERRVELALLERGVRGVRLTEAGEVLYAHARQIFALERQAEEELRARRGLEGGWLRVGASTTIANYLLPSVLGAFAQRYPRIELRVRSANTRSIVAALREYALDVALVEGPVAEEGVEAEAWLEDELVVIARPGHRLAGGGRVGVGALAMERWLLREPGSGTRAVAEAALRGCGVEALCTMEMGSTEAIKEGVAAGLGVGVVSRAALGDALARGRVVVLGVEGLRIVRRLSVLWLRERRPTPAARALGVLLREVAAAAGEPPA